MPIRLWSTVVTQLATRPCVHGSRFGSSGVPLTATAASSCHALADIGEERVELLLRPALADRRHDAGGARLVAAVPDDRLELLTVGEDRARRDRRAVVALSLQAVALRAGAAPLRCAELRLRLRRDPALVGGLRLYEDARRHLGVEDPAELAALAAVGADPLGAEPRVVRLAGNGIELPVELGDPPAVVDVVGVDGEGHDLVHRRVELVDRDRAVRVRELPVELVRVDADGDLLARRASLGDVLDPGQLVEDERRDRG